MTNVRGTNFIVSIDPVTGLPTLFVNSGLVQASGNGSSQNPAFVYPAQQLNLLPTSQEPNVPYVVDPSDLVNQVSPAIIEDLLRAKQKIDQENAEMLERMRNEASSSIPNGNSGGLSPDDLDRYQNNFDNMLANILKQARDQNLIGPDQLQALIDEANKQTDQKIDLNNVPPLQLSEEQKQQQDKQKQLAEELKKRLEEQNKQRELDAQKQSLTDRLNAEKERREQENNKKLEEARKQAEEKFKQQLSDADKQKFEEQQKALEQKRQQQEQAQLPQAPTPPTPTLPTPTPTPTPTPPTNAAPEVAKPISDRMVNSDEPIEIDMSEVFHDADGDALTFTARSSDSAVAGVAVNGAHLRITPTGSGSSEIRITANDGKGGLTETSFRFAFYRQIQNMRAEVMYDFIELYWDEYGEEGIIYHVYLNDELIESTSTHHVSLTDLKPDTVYNLRVIAVNHDEEIEAFANYSVTTRPIDF
ncbi:Ig-like domain-containing protein [Paenibacillus sp. JCM 10914]